jgi:hypothetical protein
MRRYRKGQHVICAHRDRVCYPENTAPLPARRYQKGQHVICAAPKLIEQHLKAAGSPGLVIDPAKIIWTPYNPDREYEK